MEAFQGRVTASRLKVRQTSAEHMRSDDAIFDYTVYWCPVRETYCFALMDRWGTYWTSAFWHKDGLLFEHQHGTGNPGVRINRYHEDMLMQSAISDMSSNAWYYKEALNGRADRGSLIRDEYDHLVTPAELVEGNTMGSLNKRFVIVPMSVILEAEYNPKAYAQAQQDWADAFELYHPRPEGSPLSSHAITARVARFKHRKKVTNVTRRKRRTEQGAAA